MRAIGIPHWIEAMTASTAPWRDAKETTAADVASGIPNNFNVTLVTIPSVPSEPTYSLVRS